MNYVIKDLAEAVKLPRGTRVRDRRGDVGEVHEALIIYNNPTRALLTSQMLNHFGPLTVITKSAFEKKRGRPKPPPLSSSEAERYISRHKVHKVSKHHSGHWLVQGPYNYSGVFGRTREDAIERYKNQRDIRA